MNKFLKVALLISLAMPATYLVGNTQPIHADGSEMKSQSSISFDQDYLPNAPTPENPEVPDGSNPVHVGDGSGHQTGELPQTGEGSSAQWQVLGFGLLLAGLSIKNRKWRNSK